MAAQHLVTRTLPWLCIVDFAEAWHRPLTIAIIISFFSAMLLLLINNEFRLRMRAIVIDRSRRLFRGRGRHEV